MNSTMMNERETKDVMIYLEGKKYSYHCDCGCNVFRHIPNDETGYVCNSCGATYHGK